MTKIVFVLSALATALMAGLLYGYTCSVNPGLHQLPDNQYLAAMQSISRAIQNPFFGASFMGALILLPLNVYLHRQERHTSRFRLLAAAAILYAFGVIGVTALGNIPLNNALDALDLSNATPAMLQQQRALFEGPWNGYHWIRTVCSIGVEVLVILAGLQQKGT